MSRYGKKAYEILRRRNLAPQKKFGQNFLVNKMTAEAIVAAGNLQKNDTVVEVGVGLGALTIPLAEAVHRVIGFEVDSGIIRYHMEEKDLPDNVQLVHQDILQADFQSIARECGGKITILANLPYSISNPFIFKLISNADLLRTATVMVQKEVAERLASPPNTKEYGVPTVLLASCATVHKKLTLGPAEFFPRPKIDSTVITIDFSSADVACRNAPYDKALFRQLVRTTFNQRRKTILNTMSSLNLFASVGLQDKSTNKDATASIITKAGLAPSARPETLGLEDFIRLTQTIEGEKITVKETPNTVNNDNVSK